MKVIYFDTETTGLDTKINDIVQLAFIIEIDGKVKERHNLKCQPFNYDTVTEEALDIQKRCIQEIKEWQKPEEMYCELLMILHKYIDRYDNTDKFYPAGQNVSFDIGFLRSFFEKNNDKYFGSYINRFSIDLMAIMRFLQYGSLVNIENAKLVTVAKYFDIEFKAHDAMSDIEVTREIIKKVISKLSFKE